METQKSPEFAKDVSQTVQIPNGVTDINVKALKFEPGSTPDENVFVFDLSYTGPVTRYYKVKGDMKNSTYEEGTSVVEAY